MEKYVFYLLSLPFTLGIPPLDKALEAGYIQSGAEHTVNGVQSYLVDVYAKPYSLDKLAMPYFVYRKREITIPISGGDRLRIRTNEIDLSIPF